MTVLYARCDYARCDTTRCNIALPETADEFFDTPPWAFPDISPIPNGYGAQFIVDTTGATGGTFTITVNGSESDPIDWDATASEIETILGAGFTVTGRAGFWVINFTNDASGTLTIDSGGLTGSPADEVTQTRTGQPDTSETPSLPSTPGGEADDVTVAASTTQIYTLEIRDTDDGLVADITNWSRGRMRVAVDEASQLQFRIPGTSALVANIVRPNRIVVRDRWGFVIETFDPIQRHFSRQGDAIFLDVTCLSVLARLQKEVVVSYAAEATGAAHIAALMSMQLMTPALAVGTISPQVADATVRLDVQDGTILGALKQLQDALPKADAGHFYVDALNRLQWPNTIGDQSGTTLAVGRHIQGIDAEYDYQEQVNYIFMYGAGADPVNRLKLNTPVDPDDPTSYLHATEYYQDATSVSTYGIQPYIKVDRRYTKPASLLAAAQRIVEEFKDPKVTVRVQALDLAKSINLSDYPDIYIGSTYRVVDPYQGIDTNVTVQALDYDLENPLRIGVELENRNKSLSDFFSTLAQQLAASDVDVNEQGEYYPYISRVYDEEQASPFRHKRGDILANPDDQIQIHDGEAFRNLAGMYIAANEAALPSGVSDDSTGLTLDNEVLYHRNAANSGWLPASRWVDVS